MFIEFEQNEGWYTTRHVYAVHIEGCSFPLQPAGESSRWKIDMYLARRIMQFRYRVAPLGNS